MNSVLKNDSPIKVNLSKSLCVLESHKELSFIKGAEIKLYENDNFIENLIEKENGDYISTLKPKIENKYRIESKVLGMTDCFAETVLPVPVKINNLEYIADIEELTQEWYNQITGETYDTTYYYVKSCNINFSFTDTPDEENYYFLTFKTLQPTYNNNGIPGEKLVQSITYKIGSLGWQNYIQHYGFIGYLINDELSDGKEFIINAQLDINTLPLENTVYVELQSVNRSFFDFLTSITKYEDANSPFSEPVNVYSNIENGFGIFTSYSVLTDSVSIKE